MTTTDQITNDEFREKLRECTAADFDGHSRFAELSVAQRIEWLDSLIDFVGHYKGIAKRKPLGCNDHRDLSTPLRSAQED